MLMYAAHFPVIERRAKNSNKSGSQAVSQWWLTKGPREQRVARMAVRKSDGDALKLIHYFLFIFYKCHLLIPYIKSRT